MVSMNEKMASMWSTKLNLIGSMVKTAKLCPARLELDTKTTQILLTLMSWDYTGSSEAYGMTKAADYVPPKLDTSEPTQYKSDDLDARLFESAVSTDSPTSTSADSAMKLDVLSNPFAEAFNGLEKTTLPKTKTNDGTLPDVLTDPFAEGFNNLPKKGETEKKPGTTSDGIDMFDPFEKWDSKDLFPVKPNDVPVTPKPGAETPETSPSDKPAQPPATPEDKTVKPDDVPVTPKDVPVKPKDEPVKPSDAVPNPVFNEENVGEAIKLAQSKNQPIYVFSTPNGQLDAAQQAAMKANAADAVFVQVNFAHADQMMRAGLETTHYWQLANLCGASGDVNNLYQKPGFMGRFNASDFKSGDPKNSLKPAATGDLQTIFAGQVKPPAPSPDAPGPVQPNPDAPKVGPDAKVEPNKPGSDTPAGPKDGADATPKEKEPVKLDRVKYDTDSLAEAIQAAKDNNLPLVIYEGADFCGQCPPVSRAVDGLAKNLEGKATTDAIVVKLNYERSLQLRQQNPELFKTIDKIMPTNGSSFPQVSVYNPNNLDRPISAPNRWGGDQAHLQDLVRIGRAEMAKTAGDNPARSAETRSEKAPAIEAPARVHNEDSVLNAAKTAQEKNIPMLSYLDGGKNSNPNLAKAMEYLSEKGLASTVQINRPRAEQMLRAGLETSKFYALKNAMLRTPDVAKDGSSHLSAFAPGNLRAPTKATEAAKSPDEIISFLKASGVNLSGNNAEAAVRALLEGKEVPPAPAPEVKPEAPEVKPEAPEVKPETVKPEAPEVKPEAVKPEASPSDVTPPVAPPPKEVKPEASTPEAESQADVTPQVVPPPPPPPPETKPSTPGAEVSPASNVEPVLPRTTDVQPAKLEEQAEAKTEKAKTVFKAKTAEEALKVLQDAEKSGLDLVVHSPTVICTDNSCTMTKLDASVSEQLDGEAVFLELPRGGVKVPEGAEYDKLREINALYKVTPEDHKTKIDLHVFSLDKDKKYALNDGAGAAASPASTSAMDTVRYLRARLAANKK